MAQVEVRFGTFVATTDAHVDALLWPLGYYVHVPSRTSSPDRSTPRCFAEGDPFHQADCEILTGKIFLRSGSRNLNRPIAVAKPRGSRTRRVFPAAFTRLQDLRYPTLG